MGKISYVLVKYRFIPFSILVRFNQYLADTYQYIVILSVRSDKYWLSFSALVKFNQYLINPY